MRCLIIGANGFLGARLTDALVAAGHDVAAFDRFSRGTQAFTAPGVERIVGDYLSRADLADAVRGRDIVFHLLSTTTPATADSEPTLDLRTNVSQSVALLELCAEAGIARFFYASSGGAIDGPQNDERYAEDSRVVRRIVRMVDASPRHTAHNLGSGEGHTVDDVLVVLRHVVGREFEIVDAPKPATFVDRVVLEVSRYTAEFGAHEGLSLHEGIERTWREMSA